MAEERRQMAEKIEKGWEVEYMSCCGQNQACAKAWIFIKVAEPQVVLGYCIRYPQKH